MLHTNNIDVSTVFTTHATLLGRYISAGAADLYNNLDKVRALIMIKRSIIEIVIILIIIAMKLFKLQTI